MKRTFNKSERQALYILADGKCQRCGNELGDDWEADHIEPWSKGGQTELINGQALCQKCNRKKGNKMIKYRDWQTRFFNEYLAKNLKNFLLVATPGGGKTFAALGIARMQLDNGDANLIIVVCPTDPLKRQWAKEAAIFNIHIDPYWNGSKIKDGFNGIVLTYSAVMNSDPILDWYCEYKNVFVIFDEIHHAGDQMAWGMAVETAFQKAQTRLCLSGTPFRSDDNKIPFVTYDNNGESVADFKYTYGDAIVDDVCRNIYFPLLDGEVSWWDSRLGEFIESASFDEVLTDEEEAKRRSVILHPSHSFIRSMLKKAVAELDGIRQDDPKAGGMVVTMDTEHANAVAELMKSITGEMPVVVHSNIPDAAQLIEDFDKSNKKWIVSVRMISEGVDIKRLRVGVYATNVATELMFRQIIGRVIRRMADDDDWAVFFVPKDRQLRDFMKRIKQEMSHVIDKKYRDEMERINKERTIFGDKPRIETFVMSAVHNPDGDMTVTDGIAYERNYVDEAVQFSSGIGVRLNEAQAILLLEKFKEIYGAKRETPTVDESEIKPAYKKLKELRTAVHKMAYSIASTIVERYPTGKTANDIVRKLHYNWSIKPGRNKQSEAGLEELKEKMEWLNKQLDEYWNYIR